MPESRLKSLLPSLVGLLAAFLLTGCQTQTMHLSYVPKSSITATGTVSVAAFAYGPAVYGNLRTNQIITLSPLGNRKVNIVPPVAAFFQTALSKELQLVGIHPNSGDKVLSGTINQLLFNDFPFSKYWTLAVHYSVTSTASSTTVYDDVKVIRRETVKEDEPLNTGLNETIKLNIEEIIKDPDFIKAISAKAPSS